MLVLLLVSVLVPCEAVFEWDPVLPFASISNQLIQWSAGPDALAIAGASAVRLNNRGIKLYPDHWTIRDLSSLGWLSQPCFRAAG